MQGAERSLMFSKPPSISITSSSSCSRLLFGTFYLAEAVSHVLKTVISGTEALVGSKWRLFVSISTA